MRGSTVTPHRGNSEQPPYAVFSDDAGTAPGPGGIPQALELIREGSNKRDTAPLKSGKKPSAREKAGKTTLQNIFKPL